MSTLFAVIGRIFLAFIFIVSGAMNKDAEIATANFPQIRMFTVRKA